MKKLTYNQLLKEFKQQNDLDFRTTKYFINSYFYNAKNSVYFNYDFAEKIVVNLNEFLEEKFGDRLVIYNLQMDIDSLKIQSLQTYICCRIDGYLNVFNNYIN
jgi:hypothetical protein